MDKSTARGTSDNNVDGSGTLETCWMQYHS